MISFELFGEKEVLTRLGEIPTRIITRVDATVGRLTLNLSRAAQRFAPQKSGRLVRALQRGTTVRKQPWGIIGRVGATGASKQDAIVMGAVEYGSSHKAKVIETIHKAAMRFEIGSALHFGKKVSVPAFQVPEHSFLRVALDGMRSEITNELAEAARVADRLE